VSKSRRARHIGGPQGQKKWAGRGPPGPIASAVYAFDRMPAQQIYVDCRDYKAATGSSDQPTAYYTFMRGVGILAGPSFSHAD